MNKTQRQNVTVLGFIALVIACAIGSGYCDLKCSEKGGKMLQDSTGWSVCVK